MKQLGVDDWAVQQRRRKWRFAGRVANQNTDRWSKADLRWSPQYSASQRGGRKQGHPRKRWGDDLVTIVNAAHVDGHVDWQLVASNLPEWDAMEASYVRSA